jgi:hypothetical protein
VRRSVQPRFSLGDGLQLQGVYSEKDADGIKRLYGYVLK